MTVIGLTPLVNPKRECVATLNVIVRQAVTGPEARTVEIQPDKLPIITTRSHCVCDHFPDSSDGGVPGWHPESDRGGVVGSFPPAVCGKC